MAGTKALKAIQENLRLSVQPQKFLSYADYVYRRPAFSELKLYNAGSAAITEVTVKVSSADKVILDGERFFEEIPYTASAEDVFEGVVSPDFFMNLEGVKTVGLDVTLIKDKNVVASERVESVALPFDWWSGLGGAGESLAYFVRPRLADCDKILSEAAQQLKKWKVEFEIGGYAGVDKNQVRYLAAAVFMSVKRLCLAKSGEIDLQAPILAGCSTLVRERCANSLQLALFVAACLERAKLHPVLVLGKTGVACGVWLYDCSSLDSVSDDMQRVGKYVSAGINNLSIFDVEDLYDNKSVNYSTAEAHFVQKLQAEYYENIVDIRRCRLDGFQPLPLRGQGVKGYEILKEEDISSDAPRDLPLIRKLISDGKQEKNRQWERRLLDLSLKNTLLNFNANRYALHILSADPDLTYSYLTAGEKNVLPVRDGKDVYGVNLLYGSSAELVNRKELISLENENGFFRVYSDAKTSSEVLNRLQKSGREAGEESGARILYAAFGFLKWRCKEDGKDKYAPLVLQPVNIRKNRGSDTYTVSAAEEEFSVNATLLEYLKQEFDVDIRGLGGDVSALKISEILAMIKMEIVDKKGWDVYDDVYLAAFSFSRYIMWNDVRKNINEFRKNPLISSLLNNRNELKENTLESVSEDSIPPEKTLTPLVADGSQFEAIALSQTGKTFVLHGPPGTGKSQTITNIIANALNDGKRVLFVAEKQAALNVVKKRLDAIGIGEFCLELHSGKTDKGEVAARLEATLALAQSGASEAETQEAAERESRAEADFSQSAESIKELKGEIAAPLNALHKPRRLGVSVYEAMLIYLKNKAAPDIIDVESTFYDSLTQEKLQRYENMLVSLTAAAKECGGIYRSPFENVNLSEYSQEVRDGVYCACEVMLTEIKHLKNYLGLFLELYRQRISVFTRRKIELVKEVVEILQSGRLNKFFAADERAFHAFFNANRRLDACLEYYYKNFKSLVDARKEYKKLSELVETRDGSYRNYKESAEVMKKLARVAYGKISDEDAWKYLQTVCDIYGAVDRIKENTGFAANFLNIFGNIDFKKREDYLSELNRLHKLCAELFIDYNADSFNGMCHRAVCGYSAPALEGLLLALESFERAEAGFCEAINAKKEEIAGEDLPEYYASKASALIDNIDMLAGWCNYVKTAQELDKNGLRFITDAVQSGRISGENILSSFRKNVYKNFLDINIPADPVLSEFSAAVSEEWVEQLRLTGDKFNEQARARIRAHLVSRLPSSDTDGPLSLELVAMTRAIKGKLRGMGIRALMEETPQLMKVVAPCLLMSPLTVSQYLQPTVDFDMVIFDEASQLPTGEAIGALARAKSAVIVGDPKQLPPTSFFSNVYVDEDNPESEDMESVLDDCLALGIPERYLLWHYRSKHESLIAFSNNMYYDGKLCTFPSPDGMNSKVKFRLVENGVYDRGFTKRNEAEANALVDEVIRRLKDPVLSRSSIGIVTFSSVQRDYIDRKLHRAIAENDLDGAAFDREEPLFIKNLENVQGDERDVILFSVCYGPDRQGRVSLNFGPLNQAGGWRRLNVAVSRAREEMVVFSSMTSAFIDLSRTASRGVAGLKAFLEFAQKGRTSLAANKSQIAGGESIGKYVAQELTACGYECRRDVGDSAFKIDVAIVDPKNKSRFILAIVMDSNTSFSIRDRNVLQIRTLKRGNWNVLRLYSVNYYNNPKREIKKIKELLDRLTGADKRTGSALNRAQKNYKAAALTPLAESAAYVTETANAEEITSRLKKIVAAEEPIAAAFLKKRCLSSLGVTKYGGKVDGRMDSLIAACGFKEEKILGETYYRKSDRSNNFERYRVESDTPLRKAETDFSPYDVIALVRAALEDKVALYIDELSALAAKTFGLGKPNERFVSYLNACVSFGEKEGIFVRSVSDRISLA